MDQGHHHDLPPLPAPHAVWNGLPPAIRTRFIEELADARREPGWPPGMDLCLAEAINFRPSTFRRADAGRLRRLLARAIPLLPPELLARLLMDFHDLCRPRIHETFDRAIGDILGDAGPVDGEDGDDDGHQDDDGETVELTAGLLSPVVTALVREHGRDDARLFLHSLGYTPELDAPARLALALLDGTGTSTESASEEEEEEEEEERPQAEPDPPAGRPADVQSFSSLDHLVSRAIVATLNEVEGSLDLDDLDDLVQELLELNDTRSRSHVHRGFLDAMFDRDVPPRGPGEDRQRRAWYLAGYLEAHGRRLAAEGVVAKLEGLGRGDLAVFLEGKPLAAGRHLAPLVVGALLKCGQGRQAVRWIDRYLPDCGPALLAPVLSWLPRALLQDEPSASRRVLECLKEHVDPLEGRYPSLAPELGRMVRRRLAVAWRREGRSTQAETLIDGLLDGCQEGPERQRLLGEKALLRIGVRSLERFALPPAATRESFLAGIERNRELLETAATAEDCSPIVLLALAMPAVADPHADAERTGAAIEWLQRALELTGGADRDLWDKTGFLGRCRFYLAALELRALDPALAPGAVARLHASLEEDGESFPVDVIRDAVSNAVLMDAPGSAEVGRLAVGRYRQQMLAALDIEALAERSPAFRQAVVRALEQGEQDLTVDERWQAWRQLARGCLAGRPRDADAAQHALDRLECLAEQHDRIEAFLHLLEDRASYEPAWEWRDAQEALVRLLERAGRLADARAALLRLTHKAISLGEDDVPDLVAKLASLGATSGEIEDVRRRIDDEALPVTEQAGHDGAPARGVTVLFVGGNEKQEAYQPMLEAVMREAYPSCEISFVFPSWNSNWGRLLRRIEDRIQRADAVVLMRFVRTQLGRSVRRLTSELEIPWIACTGHGRDSLERSIHTAIRVARTTSTRKA